MKRVRALLCVERLEDRLTPASWGNPWPDPQHLTLSFAPDGTPIGGQTSNLFQTMSALGPTSVWQTALLRAFQTWAVEANINIGVVSDQGLPFGTAGAIQGDSRFGDIRLGANPMASTAEAFGSPFDISAGTWSGDVLFNSTTNFSLNGQACDLFSVALHEAGHVFGLPDQNTDPTSAMYVNYTGPRTGLSLADINAVQAIYGSPSPDTANNGQMSTATPLNLLTNPDGSLGMTSSASISGLQDSDYYSFNTPLNVGGVDITVNTGGISLLTPSVTVYDANGTVVGSAVTTDPLQGGVAVHLNYVRPLSTYYVSVAGGQQNVFGIGSYQLTVHELPVVNSLAGLLTGAVNQTVNTATTFLTNTLPLNGSVTTAMHLAPESATGAASYDYAYRGAITNTSPTDFFCVQAPAAGPGFQPVLTAMVSGLDANGLVPRVLVYDSQQNPIAGQVEVNDGPSYTIQIPNAVAGQTYYVEVVAANPQGANNTGNYFLAVSLSLPAVNLQTLASGTLTGSQQVTNVLTLYQSQMFHFVLSSSSPGSTPPAAVQMTIVNASGQAVFTMSASTEPVSRNVTLSPGTYQVLFAAVPSEGGASSSLDYLLLGTDLSDPQGPQATDPTGEPSGSSSPPPPPGSSYTWSGGSSSGVAPRDPSSDPYSTSSSPSSSGTGSGGSSSAPSSTSSTSGSSSGSATSNTTPSSP
jgi:hypothetical protein